MYKHEIIFTLNENEHFTIQAQDPIEKLHCCYKAPIVFFAENKSYLLTKFDMQRELEILRTLLRDALNNKLKLNDSIKGDIGYFYNQDAREDLGSIYKKLKKHWLWSTSTEIRTWLYNDNEDNIIFEITPAYPWLYYDPEEHPEKKKGFIPYDEWIKTYKPYVIRTIPKNIAEQWLKQTQYILKHINANIKRMGEEYLARKLAEETEHHEK